VWGHGDQFFCQSRCRIDKVFATVENDEGWFFLQTIDQDWNDVVCSYRHAECVATAGATSAAPPRALRSMKYVWLLKVVLILVRRLQPLPWFLPIPPATDDRHKLLLGELHLDFGQRVATSEHPHQARGQSGLRRWIEISRHLRGERRYRTTKLYPRPGTFAIYRLPGSF